MNQLASCIIDEHNHALLAVAVLVCVCGALVTANMLSRCGQKSGVQRLAWVGIGGVIAGSTIWATHFIGMLSYEPGVPIVYDPILTFASLILAMVGCAGAFGFAGEPARYAAPLGGLAFAIAIAVMHYVGMAAVGVEATMSWDRGMVFVSLVLAPLFTVPAFLVMGRRRMGDARTFTRVVLPAGVLLVLGVVLHHLVGMAAVEVLPFPNADGPRLEGTARLSMVVAILIVGAMLGVAGVGTYALDYEAQKLARARMRNITECAVDGMVVTEGVTIKEANGAFARLIQTERDLLVGSPITDYVNNVEAGQDGELIITEVRRLDGVRVPVELAVLRDAGEGENAECVYAFRDISQRLAQERRISYLARFDALTGLMNRETFLEEAESLLQSCGRTVRFALYAIDIAQFRDVNEAHGQAVGDEVLRAAGQAMKAQFGPMRIGCRLGSDEFLVLGAVEGRDDAADFAERLRGAFHGCTGLDGQRIDCETIVGIAIYPDDGDDIASLSNDAALALTRGKMVAEAISFYDPEADEVVRRRREMIRELRRAIETDALELHYQVQVDITRGDAPVGYEALVRWRHPTRGFVMPGEFIGLAEDTGIIVDLGAWVLRTACQEAATWDEKLSIAVNLSPRQLATPDLIRTVLSALNESGLEPHRLELEVTESSFMLDNGGALAALEAIHGLGVSISIDDFGAGYSSIGLLRAFPFDRIKLDRALIDDVGEDRKANGVLRAVLSLGEAFDVPILAEGVETDAQRAYLKAQGCQLAQGYFFGRPAPMAQHERGFETPLRKIA